jgi:hypothetical protein
LPPHPGSKSCAPQAHRPDSLEIMGWDVNDDGLVFSRDIPRLVREWVEPEMESFLASLDLGWNDIRHLAFHPGGQVLRSYKRSWDFRPALEAAREVLADFGNVTMPTCLFVLERRSSRACCREKILVAALGPIRGGDGAAFRRLVKIAFALVWITVVNASSSFDSRATRPRSPSAAASPCREAGSRRSFSRTRLARALGWEVIALRPRPQPHGRSGSRRGRERPRWAIASLGPRWRPRCSPHRDSP